MIVLITELEAEWARESDASVNSISVCVITIVSAQKESIECVVLEEDEDDE